MSEEQTNCLEPSDSPIDCCDYFRIGWGKVHAAAKLAAMNGTPTKIEAINYCPWCGERKIKSEN